MALPVVSYSGMKGPQTVSETACCQTDESLVAQPRPAAKARYFCPMCEGVQSDKPGNCPKCGMAFEVTTPVAAQGRTIYTCPMHPEVEQATPGNCPICGMALELKTTHAGAREENAELTDMTRRFWVGAALTLPVFLLAMAHIFPSTPAWLAGDRSRWIQFALSTPVVLWGGALFFERGWRSLGRRT